MALLGNIFKEFSRPLGLIKSSVKNKKEAYKNLKKDITDKGAEKAPVAKDVTRDEFKTRYDNLFLHQSLVGVFTLYSLIFTVTAEGFISVITSLAIFTFFFLSYVTISYKSYLCRLYFSSWDKRQNRIKFTIYEFMSLSLSNVRLLLPCRRIEKIG